MNDETKIDDGGYVYPTVHGETWAHNKGITLRNWLAGMAMQGIVMNPDWTMDALEDACKLVADNAYKYADAIIAQGRKGE